MPVAEHRESVKILKGSVYTEASTEVAPQPPAEKKTGFCVEDAVHRAQQITPFHSRFPFGEESFKSTDCLMLCDSMCTCTLSLLLSFSCLGASSVNSVIIR